METRAKIGTYLRSDRVWAAYQQAPKRSAEDCFLCDMEAIQCFTYWYICANQYPYDNVASKHHMLVPLDHVSRETDLSGPAKRELELIFNRLNESGEYDCIMRNFAVGQSHPVHLHYHLITWKRR